MAVPSVTLKIQGSSEPIRFQLYEGGRIDLGVVRDVFELSAVEVDGMVIGMDPATHLSRSIFEPGAVLNVTGIKSGKAGASGSAASGAKLDQLVQGIETLTLETKNQSKQMKEWMSDNSSATIDASTVTQDDLLKIDTAMKASAFPSGPATLEPDSRLAYDWLPEKEDSRAQKDHVIAFITQHLQAPLATIFQVMDINQAEPRNFPKASFSCHHRSFRGRADYLIVPKARAYLRGLALQRYALAVLELKKDLQSAQVFDDARTQARLNHYIYGTVSNAAILTVLTDLRSGGVIIYTQRTEDAHTRLHIFEESISGMPALFTYLSDALTAVGDDPFPSGSSSRRTENKAETLTTPLRHHFRIEGYQQPNVRAIDLIHDALDKLDAEQDRKEDQDISPWNPDGDAEVQCRRVCTDGSPSKAADVAMRVEPGSKEDGSHSYQLMYS